MEMKPSFRKQNTISIVVAVFALFLFAGVLSVFTTGSTFAWYRTAAVHNTGTMEQGSWSIDSVTLQEMSATSAQEQDLTAAPTPDPKTISVNDITFNASTGKVYTLHFTTCGTSQAAYLLISFNDAEKYVVPVTSLREFELTFLAATDESQTLDDGEMTFSGTSDIKIVPEWGPIPTSSTLQQIYPKAISSAS